MPSRQTFFTPRDAKAAVPGQVLLIEGSPGLRLEVSETRKTWTYRYKDPQGRMKQIKLGEWPALSMADAITAWTTKRDMRATGTDPVAEKKARKAAILGTEEYTSIREFLTDFMDHLIHTRRPEGAKAACARLEALLREEPRFAASSPNALSRGMAYKILNDRNKFPAATKALRSLLGQATDRALDAGRINGETPNWWRLVMHGQLRSKGKIIGGGHVGRAKRSLSVAELRVFLPWAANRLPQIHHDITMLYLSTGMRGGEITGLRVEYISQEADGWWVTYPARLLKMERDLDVVDHRVPLVGIALEIVKRRIGQAREGWLFWTDRAGVFRPYRQGAYGTYIYDIQPNHSTVKARRQAQSICPVVGWSPHDLRRTARTMLSRLGCPDEIGEAIIGHKPAAMISTYNLHTYDAQKREWLTRLVNQLALLTKEGQADLPALPNSLPTGGS